MRNWTILALGAAALALGGCDWLTSRDDDAPPDEGISAEGKAEPGQVSVKAPGLDVTFTVPKALSRDVKVNSDIKILYPKASITGMYAAGGGRQGKDKGESEVEFRFGSADSPERILAWYQAPERAPLFKVKGVERQGADTLIRARDNKDESEFRVRLAARAGGGSDGRLVIHKKD